MRGDVMDLELPSTSPFRCAIYARKSTEEGLAQEFNTLEAQRESAEAYVQSQVHAGWDWNRIRQALAFAVMAEGWIASLYIRSTGSAARRSILRGWWIGSISDCIPATSC
jgi:hypothetical protein